MPAVTLVKSTTQSSQNCGVRHAWATATLCDRDQADAYLLRDEAFGLPVRARARG